MSTDNTPDSAAEFERSLREEPELRAALERLADKLIAEQRQQREQAKNTPPPARTNLRSNKRIRQAA